MAAGAGTDNRKIGIVGAGVTGTLFALKLAALRPNWTIFLIERSAQFGRGIAYGACSPEHLLNVPAGRMEVAQKPGFVEWLAARRAALGEAMSEAGGSPADAFVPRQLFGDYIAQRLAASAGDIRRIQGEAVKLAASPREILLADGMALAVDAVVLATGNAAPRLPFRAAASARIVADPWRDGALERVQNQDSVLLLGAGLTMVDMLLVLRARGHQGPIHAVSRHGLLPQSHRAGGSWPGFLTPDLSPRQALRLVRDNIRQAEERGVPWHRVFDAVRPAAGALWHAWSLGQRAQFLRHLRALWDVHRHRLPERAAAAVDELLWSGTLTVTAGRVLAVDEHRDGLTAMIRPRGRRALAADMDVVINCTGPALDVRRTRQPLLADALREGLIRSDPLGLGLETVDAAVVNADGVASDWLFALGPPTRPAWWEITAVPEINAQADRLAKHIAHDVRAAGKPLTAAFRDIGAGI